MDATLLSLGREALLLVLLVSAPPLAASFVAGVATGILQAATQVQDAAIPVLPRLAAALLALAAAGPWIAAHITRFAGACLELSVRVSP